MSTPWKSTADAPHRTIVGMYDNGDCLITWSDNPICMLGPRNGSYPPGWATAGSNVDSNLPMDPPLAWCLEEEYEGDSEL